MLRVLSIATLYPNAHLPRFGTFVARQMEALAARDDCEVTVINPIGVPPFPMGRYKALADAAIFGEEGGVAVHRPRFTLIPGLGGPFNPTMIARAVLPIAQRLHAAEPFDVVDAQFFYPDGPAAAQIAQALGLPLSIKARGADIQFWGRKPYASKKMRAASAQAAGLLAVSSALRQDMVDLGLPAEKITVHYTGLDRDLFRPHDKSKSRRKLEEMISGFFDDSRNLIVTVGALIPRKGQSFVIEALKDLQDTQLLVVGSGPDGRELFDQAAALAQRRDSTDLVHFLGNIDHEVLPVVLSAADAMVLPSSSEGLANAWVEALACGTPLVITDAGGARELVTTPDAGRIVTREAGAIAAGIREVIAADYDPLDVAATVKHFSWEANAEALASYYHKLIA